MKLKVYKFGGTSLEGKKKIKSAVSACISEIKGGSKLVCVVSAMGKTTDKLYNLVLGIDPDVTIEESMGIVGMGEIISARIFDYSLKKEGAKSMLLEPYSKEWPLFLKKDGSINRSRTEKNIKKYFPEFFKNFDSIVVPGFIALKKNGDWGSLGRGGSDTTAFILGKYLGAEEIVIVKDVNGVYTADPTILPNAKQLKYISADDLSTLSSFGAQVIHSDALSFKGKTQKVRIIHHSFGDLAYEGTIIDGKVTRKLFILEDKLSLISIYKKDITGDKGLIKNLTSRIFGITKVFGTTLGIDYLGFYVPTDTSRKVLEKLGNISSQKELRIVERRDIALLIMRRESPVNLPGMLNYLLTPLAKKQLNIVEVITIGREILLFIRWEDRKKAMQALKRQDK
ncbi:aspartate kinase, partial [candidate division WOR-3 bacterium]|nr:aspartate kinase [candidate division WOR-3 bacterium]